MPRILLILIVACLALGTSRPHGADAQGDPRAFSQTGYRVSDDKIWAYFNGRGGVRTFGYPVSNVFTMFGLPVQMFQRAILQIQPDGGVTIMNLLDGDLLPFTKMNGSTFPAPDPELVAKFPVVGTPDYHQKALQFVKEYAPDTWQGLSVGFHKTFSGTVRAADAFPRGGADQGLLQGFNLEVWGLPTSRPAFDPANGGFVYQRFQRGVMHFDASTGATQGLLLADYVKSLLTLSDLPTDLASEAKSSKLLGQFEPKAPLWVSRPADLPSSNLAGAFKREPTVVVDAGHGGAEIGSSYQFADGIKIQEKDLNLKVARKLSNLLREASIKTVLTRNEDSRVNSGKDLTGDDRVSLADDLQARVDIANRARADLIVSVHFNGIADTAHRGTQMFFANGRPFSDRSRALAQLAQTHVTKALKDAGHEVVDRGATPDSGILGAGSHFYLLGPTSDTIKRPTEMPGIIGEALFVTNPDDARGLRSEKVLDAVARGYFEAVRGYFSKFPVL
jgi:N-acetylmuramoyl-L-alanine amidase